VPAPYPASRGHFLFDKRGFLTTDHLLQSACCSAGESCRRLFRTTNLHRHQVFYVGGITLTTRCVTFSDLRGLSAHTQSVRNTRRYTQFELQRNVHLENLHNKLSGTVTRLPLVVGPHRPPGALQEGVGAGHFFRAAMDHQQILAAFKWLSSYLRICCLETPQPASCAQQSPPAAPGIAPSRPPKQHGGKGSRDEQWPKGRNPDERCADEQPEKNPPTHAARGGRRPWRHRPLSRAMHFFSTLHILGDDRDSVGWGSALVKQVHGRLRSDIGVLHPDDTLNLTCAS